MEGPTVTNMAFFLTCTTQTLLCMDDLLSSLLAFLQPYRYVVTGTKETIFCIVVMRYEGKTLSGRPIDEPKYHFMIPHKNPVICSIFHLAAHLHRLFDDLEIHKNAARWTEGQEWDFSKNALWRL
ncbi:hypothetical protein JCM1840_005187 [Sporobolomyces johnsonii]